MENLDRLVDLITDRLMEKLKQKPQKPSVYVIGGDKIPDLLEGAGFQVVRDSWAAEIIVVEALDFDAFLRLSSLCPIEAEEAVILKSLLKGKKVLVSDSAFAIQQYKQSSKVHLYQELQGQREKLIRYGLQFYKEGQLLALLESNHAEEPRPAEKRAVTEEVSQKAKAPSKTVLLTEKKLREMGLPENGSFKIEKGMIVTALARDYLKRQKIEIIE
ncbi:ethanolamine utilization protein [Streptococcus sanguinis]|uniref:ethanolamine utilization protein n=1 Tax=Streptococcus sanguinis TaxID=1305 RepID=UPI0022836EB7|nr:ethanolamine utilization protein [Streptococcus sanguinis]MCY7040874.1 ethanolamine utilization protein [Streptococcus sanguinis]